MLDHDKRGNVPLFDSFNALFVVGLLFLIFLFSGVVLAEFSDGVSNSSHFSFTEMTEVRSVMDAYPSRVDWIYPLILFASLLVSAALAYFSRGHMIGFIFIMIASPLVCFAVLVLSNIITSFSTHPTFSAIIAQMPITTFMVDGINPLITCIFYICVVAVAYYSGKD